MYPEALARTKLIQQPLVMGAILAIAAVLIFLANPMHIGDGGVGPWLERLLYSIVFGASCVAVLVVVTSFNNTVQIAIVWLFLGGLFLSLFEVFNLSLSFIQSKLWFLVSQGVVTTIYISLVSIAIATVIAVFGAIGKLSRIGLLYGIITFYTSLFRGLPLLVQIYLIYVGLPQIGYVVEAVPAGIAALSLCYGAYMTEVFRSGIESIPRGQWEAAAALGLRPPSTLRRIILPQALPLVVPSIGNYFIAMLKDSSLVSVIGVWELLYLARIAGNQTFQHMEMLMTAAVLYWVLSMTLEFGQSRLEQYIRKGEVR